MIDKAEFFLKNYLSEHKVQLSFNNQTLNIETEKDKYKEYKNLKERLSNYSEFTKLIITDNQDKDESLNLAIDIKNLLSLALGRRIIFDRQSYWFNGTETIVNMEILIFRP